MQAMSTMKPSDETIKQVIEFLQQQVEASTPWPEAEKPDPLAAIRLAHEEGKPVQYRNANSSGAWSQWHDYDGGKDMASPMPIDNHGGYREWRIKPTTPPFQLPPPPPGMQWHREVELGPEDVTLFCALRFIDKPKNEYAVTAIVEGQLKSYVMTFDPALLEGRMEINRSLPLTGKWNPDAWEPCKKIKP